MIFTVRKFSKIRQLQVKPSFDDIILLSVTRIVAVDNFCSVYSLSCSGSWHFFETVYTVMSGCVNSILLSCNCIF